nr:MAG TPA: hypothetical protein [Caudoviricetes sp.]
MSHILNVVFLYIFAFVDFIGDLAKPIPFFPYPGMIAFLICRFALPVVLAFKLFLILGFLRPTFIFLLPHFFFYCIRKYCKKKTFQQ